MVVEVHQLGVVACLARSFEGGLGEQARVAVAAWTRAYDQYVHRPAIVTAVRAPRRRPRRSAPRSPRSPGSLGAHLEPELEQVAAVLHACDLERSRTVAGCLPELGAEDEEHRRPVRDAEAIGLELAALARLDRERRAGELDAVIGEQEVVGRGGGRRWRRASSQSRSAARKNEYVIASGTPRTDMPVIRRSTGSSVARRRARCGSTARPAARPLRARRSRRRGRAVRRAPATARPRACRASGWATNVPRPWTRMTWRSSSRIASAWRTTTRLTP